MDVIDQAAGAIERLPSFLADAAQLQALMRALLAPAVELESSFQTMNIGRTLEQAEGSQLDDIGGLFLFPRAGRDDNTYRLWLGASLLALRSAGRNDDLIGIVQLLAPAAIAVDVQSLAPSTAIVEVEGLPIASSTLLEILTSAKGAGIRLDLVWTAPGLEPLLFGDTNEAEVDLVHGLGDDSDPSIGGVLASV